MKKIPKLKRHNYLTRIGIFLIAIALIVGTVSCAGGGGGGGGGPYTLTMAENPLAGGTATDLTGGSPYAANTVVNIQAAANPGYNFSSWSAPAGSFGNAALATTTFTMPAQNVIITANFALAPGYYTLTMAVNPGGSGTATDLTGGSPYTNGTVVSIQAVANPGYQFVNWTSSAGGTFGNATALMTNFTMPNQSVTVTANFAAVLYTLTMAANPPAGGTATDLTGASPYAVNTVVSIQAVANPGYQFVSWSAPAGSFGNAALATTTFTMPAQNVTVTANFALIPTGALDHFTMYQVDSTWYIGQDVALADQFGTFNATVDYAGAFCNPAGKSHDGNVTQMQNADHHFTLYGISIKGDYVVRYVEVDNQFGLQNLTVEGPMALLVPTQKEGHAAPVGLDHYLVYYAYGSPVYVVNVSLSDQWGNQTEFMVWEPIGFAIPAKKAHDGNVTDIVDPETHLVIYDIYGESINKTVQVANQFGNQTLNVSGPYGLLVPSEKIVPPAPQLDHFKCYSVGNATPVGEFVDVADQFGYYSGVMVLEADWFCNPVQKNTVEIVNYDNHLTVYNITGVTPGWWNVTVDNQFGWQELTVTGPVALAAPTWKTYPNLHGPPKYLDHYLLYEVVYGSSVSTVVNLDDEFPGNATVLATMPRYFANPVLYKYHYGGNETGVWDPEAHLLFYNISGNPEWFERVEIYNQFVDYESLNLSYAQLLAVPSEKWYYKQI